MVRSITLSDHAPVPAWARYAVMFVDSAASAVSTVQYFAARVPCERWAREVMRRMPRGIPGEWPPSYALVYALPPTRRERVALGLCYLSVDPGAVVVKRLALRDDYGYPAAPTTAHAPY